MYEMWNIVKKFKSPSIDLKLLNKLTTKKNKGFQTRTILEKVELHI